MSARYFDYQRVARDAGLGEADLHRLEARLRAEFPVDDMLFELHLLRACAAIRDGFATVADIGPAAPLPVRA